MKSREEAASEEAPIWNRPSFPEQYWGALPTVPLFQPAIGSAPGNTVFKAVAAPGFSPEKPLACPFDLEAASSQTALAVVVAKHGLFQPYSCLAVGAPPAPGFFGGKKKALVLPFLQGGAPNTSKKTLEQVRSHYVSRALGQEYGTGPDNAAALNSSAREQLQGIVSESKRLPAIHKFSLQLFKLFPNKAEAPPGTQEVRDMLEVIAAFQEKVRQLARDANERRQMFGRIQSGLGQLENALLSLSAAGRAKDAALAAAQGIDGLQLLHYAYCVLQHPVFRAVELLRPNLRPPMIPLLPGFFQWAAAGERLAALHAGWQAVPPFPLETHTWAGEGTGGLRYLRAKGAVEAGGARWLDGIPDSVAGGIDVAGESPLSWVLAQCKALGLAAVQQQQAHFAALAARAVAVSAETAACLAPLSLTDS